MIPQRTFKSCNDQARPRDKRRPELNWRHLEQIELALAHLFGCSRATHLSQRPTQTPKELASELRSSRCIHQRKIYRNGSSQKLHAEALIGVGKAAQSVEELVTRERSWEEIDLARFQIHGREFAHTGSSTQENRVDWSGSKSCRRSQEVMWTGRQTRNVSLSRRNQHCFKPFDLRQTGLQLVQFTFLNVSHKQATLVDSNRSAEGHKAASILGTCRRQDREVW